MCGGQKRVEIEKGTVLSLIDYDTTDGSYKMKELGKVTFERHQPVIGKNGKVHHHDYIVKDKDGREIKATAPIAFRENTLTIKKNQK